MKLSEILNSIFENTSFDDLRSKLLSFGGKSVDEVFEENLNELLTRGQVFKPSKIEKVKMKQSRCHENAACFWYNYTKENGTKDLKIATGWALYGDEWVQHSWLYMPISNRIIETTIQWTKYFGYILTDDEAREFYFNNN
jgi:hypothetical protein